MEQSKLDKMILLLDNSSDEIEDNIKNSDAHEKVHWFNFILSNIISEYWNFVYVAGQEEVKFKKLYQKTKEAIIKDYGDEKVSEAKVERETDTILIEEIEQDKMNKVFDKYYKIKIDAFKFRSESRKSLFIWDRMIEKWQQTMENLWY